MTFRLYGITDPVTKHYIPTQIIQCKIAFYCKVKNDSLLNNIYSLKNELRAQVGLFYADRFKDKMKPFK